MIRDNFPGMDGAGELIDSWHAAGHLLAVASSGPPENIAIVLDQLARRDRFQAVITGADVTRGKPDPQVFLLAAEGLGLPASRCAVIEDAPAGVAAAKAAGMLAIALVSTGHTWESLSSADHRVASLRDLTPQRITEWFDRSSRSPAAEGVPVYNCHACLSAPDTEGWITARCSNLPEIVVRGKSQREALATLVAAFKAAITRYRTAGQPIPWIESPVKPLPGEQERWIAVHL